ncbi:MAG: hypothetical protein ACM3XM_20805 [Mycobacterium leprae]
MSIRPIDTLTLIPTLNQANRLQHEKQFQPMLMQQVQDVVKQGEYDRAKNQVKAKENAEHARIQQESKGKGEGGEPKHSKKEQPNGKTAAEGQKKPQAASHHLDVKV